jgi:NAD+ synthase
VTVLAIEDYALASEHLVTWMRERAEEARASGAVFGLSGGLDSALVLALARKAFGDRCLALIMPCHSLQEDVDDALLLARLFDCPYKVVDLGPAYDALLTAYRVAEPGSDPGGDAFDGPGHKDGPGNRSPASLARANLKPRLFMATWYYHANIMDYLVVGSSNKDELYVGYSTKYGDSGVDIMPLANLTKGEVKAMAAYMGVPRKILERVPSAGLWKGQTDEEEMGITYRDLDAYLAGQPVSDDVREKIEGRHRNSEHKRRMPPVPNRF